MHFGFKLCKNKLKAHKTTPRFSNSTIMIETILSHYWLILWTTFLGGLLIRLTMCLPSYNKPRKISRKDEIVSTMIVWGSGNSYTSNTSSSDKYLVGGHTTEMILLLKKINVNKFQPIYNVLANVSVLKFNTYLIKGIS